MGYLCLKLLPTTGVGSRPSMVVGFSRASIPPNAVAPMAWPMEEGPQLDGKGPHGKERARPCFCKLASWMGEKGASLGSIGLA